MKGEHTMLVKAKGNVRDAAGWHKAGEIFFTESDLGDAVEVLDAPKKAAPVKEAPEKAEPVPQEPVKAEPEKEASKEPAKAKTTTTRRRTTAK